MYASTSPSNLASSSSTHQRVNGSAAISFKTTENKTRLDKLYQHGSAKIRLPKTYGGFAEAVLINTAGGLTGGDRIDWNINLNQNTQAVITTQACEKSYKASSDTAQVTTQISVGENATCHWLPQETILYEGSSLNRVFDVQLTQSAKLIAMEAVMLGREAMGETIQTCFFKDQWRIHRDGKIIFADDVKLDGDIANITSGAAQMHDHKTFATLVYCGPEDDEQLELIADGLRALLQGMPMAISAFKGKHVARFLAPDTYKLRASLMPLLKALSGNDLPRVWRI